MAVVESAPEKRLDPNDLPRWRKAVRLVPDTYDRLTLALTGAALNAVSAVQIAHGVEPARVPNLGAKHEGVLRRLVYDSGQHFGPSVIAGCVSALAISAYAKRLRPGNGSIDGSEQLQERTLIGAVAFGAIAVGGATAANTANELLEVATGHDVLGSAVEGIASGADVSAGAGVTAATLLIAAGIGYARGLLSSQDSQRSEQIAIQ